MANKQPQYTYKNTSDRTQVLVGVGSFEPGETFTTFDRVTNPNFTQVTTSKVNEKAKAAEANEAPQERTESKRLQEAKGSK